jgi:hypothetical protein
MRLEAFERDLGADELSSERRRFGARIAGVVRRTWRRLIASQKVEAREIAYRHLATRTDLALRDLGFSAGEIRRIRTRRRPADPHWNVR